MVSGLSPDENAPPLTLLLLVGGSTEAGSVPVVMSLALPESATAASERPPTASPPVTVSVPEVESVAATFSWLPSARYPTHSQPPGDLVPLLLAKAVMPEAESRFQATRPPGPSGKP